MRPSGGNSLIQLCEYALGLVRSFRKGALMSAYLVAFVTAHTLDWFSDYGANVPPIVRRHGGRYLAVPKVMPNAVELVEGTGSAPGGIVLFSFPSMDAIKSFLEDPEYAPYRKARIAATESNFFAFENDDDAPQFVGQ